MHSAAREGLPKGIAWSGGFEKAEKGVFSLIILRGGAWVRGTHAGCGFERFLGNKKPGAWAGFFDLEVPKTLPKITSKTLKP